MGDPICYFGDDDLTGAAAYLAGVMLHAGLGFEHVPSTQPPPAELWTRRWSAIVVSDYPAARFGPQTLEQVVQAIRQGTGLLMAGGWESYHGRLGEYPGTPLAEVLPVDMLGCDDRRNFAQPCLVRPLADHPVLAGLPWETPPAIGGLNQVRPKPGSQTVLAAVPFEVRLEAGQFSFRQGEELPLLVLGRFGRGRTAALATDVAPHWVGGLVDWGQPRIVQPVGNGFVEVGSAYVRLLANLLRWITGEDRPCQPP